MRINKIREYEQTGASPQTARQGGERKPVHPAAVSNKLYAFTTSDSEKDDPEFGALTDTILKVQGRSVSGQVPGSQEHSQFCDAKIEM